MEGFVKHLIYIVTTVAFLLAISSTQKAHAQGSWGLSAETLANQRSFSWEDYQVLPGAFTTHDWRRHGVVTSSEYQGGCGACWAIAGVGAMEAKLALMGQELKKLSWMQHINCNNTENANGCNGGLSDSVFKYHVEHGPMTEECAPEFTFGGWECSAFDHCKELTHYVTDIYSVEGNDIGSLKASLLRDGPGVFVYIVKDDFKPWWLGAGPGAIYSWDGVSPNLPSETIPRHDILLIGWSDYKQAWLLKNSWGKDAGPNGDGTFWMSWNAFNAGSLNYLYSNYSISAGYQLFVENELVVQNLLVSQSEAEEACTQAVMNYPGQFVQCLHQGKTIYIQSN